MNIIIRHTPTGQDFIISNKESRWILFANEIIDKLPNSLDVVVYLSDQDGEIEVIYNNIKKGYLDYPWILLMKILDGTFQEYQIESSQYEYVLLTLEDFFEVLLERVYRLENTPDIGKDIVFEPKK